MSDLNVLSERALRGEYARAMQGYTRPGWLEKIACIIADAKDRNRIPWVGGSNGGMRERTAGGSTQKPNIQYVDADVVEYEDGIEIPIKDVRRDEIGALNIASFMSDLAQGDAEHWEELVLTAILNGAATACYDTQYFFDDDHADLDGSYTTSQSNDLTADISTYPVAVSGSTTAPSLEELMFATAAGITAIQGFKNNAGRYINRNAKQFVVLMSSTMWLAAHGVSKLGPGYGVHGLLNEAIKSEGMDVQFVSSPLLATWTTSFAVFRTDVARKAILAVEEKLEPELRYKVGTPANDRVCRKQEKYEFEVRANRRVKYGDWRSACYVTLT